MTTIDKADKALYTPAQAWVAAQADIWFNDQEPDNVGEAEKALDEAARAYNKAHTAYYETARALAKALDVYKDLLDAKE